MSESAVRAILSVVVPAVLFGVAGFVTHAMMKNRTLVELDATRGCTTSAGIVATTALFGAGLVALFCYAYFFAPPEDPDQEAPLRWLIVGFTISAAFMAAMALHRWRWNEHGLEFRGVLRTISLRWSELDQAGPSWHGGWLARDRDGRRIYWSSDYTIGGDVITAAVAHYRPDLIAPS